MAVSSLFWRETRIIDVFNLIGCARSFPINIVSQTISGDPLDALDHRHEWANFHFTWTHFKFVLTKMLPVVASHSKSADEAEINSQYDRELWPRFPSIE